ncbi:MAG: hypothetical protein DRI95_03905 [Bacteroidetes bacterium]|nr:MAG: hypothetical protein DRI95_03905 [Bacteroidota bacterium]
MNLIKKKKLNASLKNLDLTGIIEQDISGLEKVKTIIFSKKDILSKGKHKLKNVENRSTVSKKTVIEIATQLAKLWESPYAKTLNKKLNEPLEKKKFLVTKKTKQGISVVDEAGKKLQLGNYSFVQEYVKTNDDTSLFLLKNNILIGKFTFKEKLNKKAIKLAQALNSYGNLVYLDSEFENSNSMLPFDRAYVSMNNEEQKNIISKLSAKAKTALITTNDNLTGIADYDFLISESNNSELSGNHININFNNLLLIEKLFFISKKAQIQSGYALLFLVLILICILILLTVIFIPF